MYDSALIKKIQNGLSYTRISQNADVIIDKFTKSPELAEKFIKDLVNLYSFKNQSHLFKLVSSAKQLSPDHEVWFSGKCVVVPQSYWRVLEDG